MILATPIKCWTCRNAYSYAECQSKGYLVTCQSNQESCELEVRERNGYVIQVNTGCKQAMACENNKAQNFQLGFKIFWKFRFWASFWTWFHQSDPAHTQCRPEAGYTHSVCRQCCYTGTGHSSLFEFSKFYHFLRFMTWWSVRKDSCVSSPTFWQPTTRAEWSFWACKSNKITFPSYFRSITQFSSGPVAFVCYSERIYYHDAVFTRMTTSHPSDNFLRVSHIKETLILLLS